MNKIKNISTVILITLSFTGLFLNFDSNAEYEIQPQQMNNEEKDIVEKIEKVDPQQPKKNKFKRKSGKIIDNSLLLNKEFYSSDKKVNFIKDNSNIEIGTPIEIKNNNISVQEDKIIYESTNNTVDLTLENIDGGIRQVIVIHDKNQPNRYTFPIKTADNQKFVKNNDESVQLIDSNKNTIIHILKPWARDKNNKELQTYYEVEKTQIVQYINLENAEFPVTADPLFCGEVASSVSWNKRDYYDKNGRWSLTIVPTWCGINVSGPTPWASWQEIYNKAPYHPAWAYPQSYGTDTYWSMYNQYICHTDWKALNHLFDRKNPWNGKLEYNIEPWRKNVGYWEFVKVGCNGDL